MNSTVQVINGIGKLLNHLEHRISRYKNLIRDQLHNRPPTILEPVEQVAITDGEIATLEALIRAATVRITGAQPIENVWEEFDKYCKNNAAKKSSYYADELEYFRWGIMWIQKTRAYVEFLSGMQSAVGMEREDVVGRGGAQSMDSVPRYDIAISFAGEDRNCAKRIADLLLESKVSIFFDEYEQSALWGRNLFTHLSDFYQNRAIFCLMIISQSYAQKIWTRREREAAQARAFRENSEYILPLRLDDTELPGLDNTVGYIDHRIVSAEEVVRLLKDKLAERRSRIDAATND